MSVAFTNLPIIYIKFKTNSTSLILSTFHNAFLSAGWEFDETLDDGYRYILTSPQDLTCKVTLRITGSQCYYHRNAVEIQFMDITETYLGPIHYIAADVDSELQAIIGVCQLFINRVGIVNPVGTYGGHNICGGIPWTPNGNESIWWSMGDSVTDNTVKNTFRDTWTLGYLAGKTARCYGAFLNGNLMGPTGDLTGSIRLVPYTKNAANPWGSTSGPAETKWFDDSPLYFDPLIAWGMCGGDTNSFARIRGQLWDAMWVSLSRSIDYLEVYKGITWLNYTAPSAGMGSYFGCLYLAKDAVGVGGIRNYAY